MIYVSYYPNLAPEILSAHEYVIAHMAKKAGISVPYARVRTDEHWRVFDHVLSRPDTTRAVFLDADCIPTTPEALKNLMEDTGPLFGCAQRANHIENGGHVYVSAFCLSITRDFWLSIGSPSARPTNRGDVAEEITYAAQKHGHRPRASAPVHVVDPLWDLAKGQRFGIGTTYANGMYHQFHLRDRHDQFINKCEEVTK